jgi:hypothetical protein
MQTKGQKSNFFEKRKEKNGDQRHRQDRKQRQQGRAVQKLTCKDKTLL